MANIITVIRILCSIALLFFSGFSPAFYVLYIFEANQTYKVTIFYYIILFTGFDGFSIKVALIKG